MSTMEKTLTTEDLEVLALVKLLNEFKNPYSPNDTLGKKIDEFSCESADMDRETFDNGLDKLCEAGILTYDSEYKLTEAGKELFGEISKKWSDALKEKAGDIYEQAKQFVHDNRDELIMVVIQFGSTVWANHL